MTEALLKTAESADFKDLTDDEKSSIFEEFIKILDKRLKFRKEAVEKQQDKLLKKSEEKIKKTHGPTKFEPDDLVFLTQPTKTRKGVAQNLGPYKIIAQKSRFYYTIKDLTGGREMKVHISRLRECISDESEEELKKLQASDSEAFEVEEIVDHRGSGKRNLYFTVKWRGYDDGHNTEFNYMEVKDLEAIDKYSKKHPELSYLEEK
ncbi:hypothetical protein ADUPG1_001824 [Aduncisulcus paluster]|uniref:Chromo domain-containing protein n=1 Tax=Aduncisulcus paluster TaxID=2918883 RepID=A0ABQ5KJD9_9EUKA|nr:hypothetical protein ADUPG1_001824 [Aduncisulcus paluster]